MSTPAAPAAHDERLEWAALAALTALAAALRIYRLTEWSLSDDEYYTWKNSLEFSWSNPRPLLFALNHYFVWPVLGLRELGLRIIPAATGVAAVPTVYIMLRRLNLGIEGLTTAALVSVGTWHVYWSQFARYYAPVFLCSAVCGLAFMGWTRHRRAGWLWVAVASGVLAVLAHPSALPVVGSAAVTVALHEHRRSRGQSSVWPWALALGAALVAAATRYGPILAYWTREPSACCHTSVGLALTLLDWMTAPVFVCALAGMALWWWAEPGPVPQIVVASALLPTVLFLGLSQVMSVSLSYLFAAAPFYFLAAGWFVARVARSVTAPGSAALVGGAAAVMAVASANLVGLASHYRDGGRLPYRDAATALAALTQGRDTILAEGTGHVHFYAPQLPVVPLPIDSLTLRRMVRPGGAAWVLAPRVDRAGFGYYERQFAPVYAWLNGHCALMKEFTAPRLDFRRNALQLFRCVPDIGVVVSHDSPRVLH